MSYEPAKRNNNRLRQILQTREEIPQNLRSYIEKISIAGNNLLNLVNTILDFANLKLESSPPSKMTLISDIVKDFNLNLSLAEGKKYLFGYAIRYIFGSFYRRNNLWNNLSHKHTLKCNQIYSKQWRVAFSIMFDKQKNQYVLSICDNGVGMSKESISQLFTPFTQIDNIFKFTSKGTGLGLVITKKIVEDFMCGNIWVESTIDEEAVLYCYPIQTELKKLKFFVLKTVITKNSLSLNSESM